MTRGPHARAFRRPIAGRRTPGWRLRRAAVAIAVACLGASAAGGETPIQFDVPIVQQAPERCGPAALRMVLSYQGASDSALAIADRAYDPVLRGSLVTELAARARDAGWDARVARADADSLVRWLGAGLPPIVLVGRGIGPLVRSHYLVVTGFDPGRRRFTVHDGGATARELSTGQLDRQWARTDRVALVIRPVAAGPKP